MCTFVLVLLTTLIATLRPFKSASRHNVINIIFLQLLTLFSITALSISITVMFSPVLLYFFYVLCAIIGLVPFLYFVASFAVWVYTHKRYSVDILHRLRAYRHGYSLLPGGEQDASDGSLPDRIKNPSGYHSENLTNFHSK